MERCVGTDKIILLFESYTSESKSLYESLKQVTEDCLAIVLEENDFLPKGVLSVYDLVLGNYTEGLENIRTPRYYNGLVVPEKWSINAGVEEKYGRITYQHEEKGKIHYAESEKDYTVKSVDWHDRKGVTRFRDHYNRYGVNCARTVYDAEGQPMSKSWFSDKGKEIIVENYVTGDIILNDEDVTKIFRNKVDVFIYVLNKLGLAQNRIFYNSLSTPFLISNGLDSLVNKDVLFWQEPTGEEVPGNMQVILEGRTGRTRKIMVQKRDSYNKLLELGVNLEMIKKLGFIYEFKKENMHRPEALICTNSEEIEHCQELIKAFPKMHFHIAALTMMSTRLMNLKAYGNVSLYPAISAQTLDELLGKCDYYFDINHWDEIASVVYRAFIHNHLIFAFQETVHHREYVADEHIYPTLEFEKMVSDVKAIMEDEGLMKIHLKKQHENAMTESKETYRKVLDI